MIADVLKDNGYHGTDDGPTMVGASYPSGDQFVCVDCTQKVISKQHFNACPDCGGLMTAVSW